MFFRRQLSGPTQIPTGKHYLVVNTGSSSIKLVIFDAANLQPIASGQARLIGQPHATLTTVRHDDSEDKTVAASFANDTDALSQLMDWVASVVSLTDIAAVGHRLVHGGPDYAKPVIITADVFKKLQTLVPFDRLHMEAQLAVVTEMTQRLPHSAQVACFDTAFHHDLPEVAQTIALPRQYRELGIRRYGFHGLSYSYICSRIAELDGESALQRRIIIAHLGSGASLAALKDGKPVDTTMGFSTNSGIVMSTRTGDIDAGVPLYLQQTTNLSLEQFAHIASTESGLLGVSGKTADMYELLTVAAEDPDAALAVDLFCYQARKAIGSLAATLGGVDMLVFTGGIGERSAVIRKTICQGLEFLDISIELDEPDADGMLSGAENPVAVRVIPANEELVIVRHIQELRS
ncbi:MAG TPA: acetate/propionate family kinase [Candidatus Saccharimonadales bacterium]